MHSAPAIPRVLAVLAIIGVLIGSLSFRASAEEPQYGDIIGPVTATSMGIKMPETKEVYDRLSEAQKAYLEQQIYSRRDEVVQLTRAGAIRPKIIATGPVTTTSTSGKLLAPFRTHVYVQYACMVAASDTIGGSWMNGGGKTDSFGVGMYDIRARGYFYKNGSYQNSFNGGCLGCSPPSSFAQGWTAPVWKYWWDQAEWVVESWHNAQSSQGHWDLGPDRYCYISKVY